MTAELPRFFPDPLRFNWGFPLALIFAVLVWWFLFKTTLGLRSGQSVRIQMRPSTRA